jgi:DNA-binding NarL/FixJ family response regulator
MAIRPRCPRALHVLLVEDSPALRDALSGVIRSQRRVGMLQVADTAAEALRLLEQAPPDIVILDLTLREGSGLEVLARLRELRLSCRILVFTGHDTGPVRAFCLAAGADRFFSKSRQHRDLLNELREICG